MRKEDNQMITTKKLTKNYGNNKGAIDVNLELTKGEVVGFIGPNGAGKTTTILMLTGFIVPDSGTIEVFNKKRTHLDIYKIMPQIGVLMSNISYNKNDTAQKIFTDTQELLNKNLESNWKRLAEELDLDIFKKFKELSYGNKKKVGIIAALMHKPKLLILDEPTSGLDPLIQQKFLKHLVKLKESGSSILLSSHVLSEVQSICDRVVMIKDAKIILVEKTKDLLEKSGKLFKLSTKDFEKIKPQLNTIKYSIISKVDKVQISVDNSEEMIKLLISMNIYNFLIEEYSLEDMFLKSYE